MARPIPTGVIVGRLHIECSCADPAFVDMRCKFCGGRPPSPPAYVDPATGEDWRSTCEALGASSFGEACAMAAASVGPTVAPGESDIVHPDCRASLRARRIDALTVRAVDVPRAARACPCCGELWVGGRCGRRRPDAVAVGPTSSVVSLTKRAFNLLNRGDASGWVDLFEAVTLHGKAGNRDQAAALLTIGDAYASTWCDGSESLRAELRDIRAWLASQPSAGQDAHAARPDEHLGPQVGQRLMRSRAGP